MGAVISHEDSHYIVKMLDGRVCGFRANSGTPSEEDAETDIANPAPEPVSVPASITQRQLRLELLSVGVTDAMIRSQLEGDPAGLIEWEYAQEIKRAHPLVEGLGDALGFSSVQIDEMFKSASLI